MQLKRANWKPGDHGFGSKLGPDSAEHPLKPHIKTQNRAKRCNRLDNRNRFGTRGSELARMLLDHLEGILNYCRTKVPMGVIEAVNGNIKALLRRGRGYRDMNYLLLKVQRLAATKTEFLVLQKVA